MITSRRRPTPAAVTRSAVTPQPVPAPHRQQFAVEVAYFARPADVADCLAGPTGGRRTVLYGGPGLLPPPLADMTDRVVRASGRDAFAAAVVAWAGTKPGDTLTMLLPTDWAGPPAEALLDHARRWFASPHSSEDEAV